MKIAWFCSLLAVLCFSACNQSSTEQKAPATTNTTTAPAATPTPVGDTNEVAVIKTSEGDLVIEFWPDVAPKTVENFKKLARGQFYDATCFHRIIPDFMIQGGDPLTKDPSKRDQYGKGGPTWTVPAEFSNRKHERGVISMARGKDINSAGSQFFICLGNADNPRLQKLNGQYTAFGKLIIGDEVLEKISKTPLTGPNSMGEMSVPVNRIEVFTVFIVPRSSMNK